MTLGTALALRCTGTGTAQGWVRIWHSYGMHMVWGLAGEDEYSVGHCTGAALRGHSAGRGTSTTQALHAGGGVVWAVP